MQTRRAGGHSKSVECWFSVLTHTDVQRISTSAERLFPITPSYRRPEDQEGVPTSVECLFSMTPCNVAGAAARGGRSVGAARGGAVNASSERSVGAANRCRGWRGEEVRGPVGALKR